MMEEIAMTYEIKDGKLYDESGTQCRFLRVKIFERQTRDGEKFNAYKAILDNKRYCDLSFTMDCPEVKAKNDFVLVEPEVNIDTNRLYPRIYVMDYMGVINFDRTLIDTYNRDSGWND